VNLRRLHWTELAVGPAVEDTDYARKVLIGDILEIRHLGQDVAWGFRGYCGWEVDGNGC